MEKTEKTFVGASKEYFGLKDGQDLKGFSAEVQALSPKDKLDIAHGIQATGVIIKDFEKLVEAAN